MEAIVVNSESALSNNIQDLVQSCRSGNQKAQFRIYKLYSIPMYNLCMSIVNNRTDAEEIMQESFLSAFEKIDTYQETVSFGDWLRRIVVTRSYDSLSEKSLSFE